MSSSNDLQGRYTSGELSMASFWVKYRLALWRFGRGFLMALAILLWGYVIVSLLDAYAISYPRESRLAREIALNQQQLVALESDRPQDVSLSDVSVLQTTGNRIDLMVEMTNPNPSWWAEFTYRFLVSGEETPLRSGYVLPNGAQIVTELGYAPKTVGGASATLQIDTVRWHRVNPALVGSSYEEYAKTRFALEAQNIATRRDLLVGAQSLSQTSFTLINTSAYGFWNVELVLRLFRGPSLVAINTLTVAKIRPGEKRPLEVVWFENPPGITKTEVIPQVNLLDQRVYLPTQYF